MLWWDKPESCVTVIRDDLRWLKLDLDRPAGLVSMRQRCLSILSMFRRSFLSSGAISQHPKVSFPYTSGRWLDNAGDNRCLTPYALCGLTQFVTASEVATMGFDRKKLGLLVPRVLSSSWRRSEVDSGHNCPRSTGYI